MKKISEQEYNEWLKTADRVEDESPTFTSCCGPHEFAIIIHKNGMLYELCWGWYPEEDKTPNPKYKYKTTCWWGIKTLHREFGQEGEGI
jgi:hypothetical protein